MSSLQARWGMVMFKMRYVARQSKIQRPTRRRYSTHRICRIEMLGVRCALHGSGLGVEDPIPWFSPGELTYSFAPDGTDVAGNSSQLFESLNQLAPSEEWQSVFADAFEAWLNPLGATTIEVSDSGDPFGTTGPTQRDPRFGDVRIGSIPLSQNILATSVPHSIHSQGTWAGDILLNSNAQWNNLQEIFAVALHEYGHVLGLPHSSDPTSVMFTHGVHSLRAPSAEDQLNLQEMYSGIPFDAEDDRRDDAHESDDDDDARLPNRNFDPANAIDLEAVVGQSIRYSALDQLVDPETPVLYRLLPTAKADNYESLTIVMRSLSGGGLIPELFVFDGRGRRLDHEVYHHSEGIVAIQVSGVANDEAIYVMASSSIGLIENQLGRFELIADYHLETRDSRPLYDLTFDATRLMYDSNFSVATSRLVHLRIAVKEEDDEAGTDLAVWARLLDSNGTVMTRVAVRAGTTRTAPLLFLPQGDYTLRFEVGSRETAIAREIKASVYLDESSIDVGPGVVDPTEKPTLWCGDINADPLTCYTFTPIDFLDPPIVRDPQIVNQDPTYPVTFPWEDPIWWYILQPATVAPQPSPWHNLATPEDVSGDGLVHPQDALMIINLINRSGRTQVDVDRNSTAPVTRFTDVNGDFVVTPIDALIVINRLNRQGQTPPEGEGANLGGGAGPVADSILSDVISWTDPEKRKLKKVSR